MPISLQQIFYGHDGSQYKVYARSRTFADDFTVNSAIEKVNDRLNTTELNSSVSGAFEDQNFYYWFLASPGKKDYSGRPTLFLHIILCDKKTTESNLISKKHLIYSKLLQEYSGKDFLINDLIISDDELANSPSELSNDSVKKAVGCNKRTCFIIIIGLFAGIICGLCFPKKSGSMIATSNQVGPSEGLVQQLQDKQQDWEILAKGLGVDSTDDPDTMINRIKKNYFSLEEIKKIIESEETEKREIEKRVKELVAEHKKLKKQASEGAENNNGKNQAEFETHSDIPAEK